MGLGDFWNKLTGRDKAERVDEQLQEDQAEEPEVEDYQAMRDDIAAEERLGTRNRPEGDE